MSINKFAKRYFDFKSYLLQTFGEKVYKVTIDAGFSCPNRDGSKGRGGCIYCNSLGSKHRVNDKLVTSIEKQIEEGKSFYKKSVSAKKFIAYFQTYTNTYSDLSNLKRIFYIPLSDPEIVGISIGTRPDCVDIDKLNLIESLLTDKKEIWIEYGLQTIHQKSLDFINRGHTLKDFTDAIEITKGRGIKICVHIIVGLPYETDEMIMETAKFISQLPIDAVKIHSLMLLKGTLMEDIYNREPFDFMTIEKYVQIVVDILEILPPSMVIQRLTGDGYREIFLAPEWCINKLKVLNMIENELKARDTFQGKFFGV